MNYEMIDDGFRERLENLIGEEKPFSWSVRIGLTPGVFTRMWNEGKAPKADALLLISEKTGCSINWLLMGEGSMWREGFGPEADRMLAAADRIAAIHNMINGNGSRSGEDLTPQPINLGQSVPIKDIAGQDYSLSAQSYVQIPRYEVAASAGGGAIVQSEQIVDFIGFKEEWVRNSLGTSAQNLALISVKGDSMDPTLSDGDLVLVDTTSRSIEANAIYVIQFWGSLLVKRVQRKMDGTVVIRCDNSIYEPEIVTGDLVEQLNVIGRVVWYGKRA